MLDPGKGERAMLVKDAEGDYAVIVGRWNVMRCGKALDTASTPTLLTSMTPYTTVPKSTQGT